MLETLLLPIVKILVLVGGLMTAAAYFVLLERWMAAWIQDRVGPNRVGIPLLPFKLFGLGQPLADGAKFILKEEYTPAHVDRRLFVLAPIVILAAALAVFAVVPMGATLPPLAEGGRPIDLVVAPSVDVGLVYVFALSSIAVYGVVLGGWASNNKYSFLGALRSSAQLIAYELPLGLGLLGVVLASGTMDLGEIIRSQAQGSWHALSQPLGFLVFVTAAFAEAGRLPFDLPECEQELIGGYHTEYSGMKLLLFLVAEFLHMITAAFLITILFLGGWHFPGLGVDPVAGWGLSLLRMGVLLGKVFLVIVFFMIVRWSWPRFRFDQLMALAWKVMLPLGMVNLLAVALLDQLAISFGDSIPGLGWLKLLAGWVVFGVTAVVMGMWGPLVADNRPRPNLAPGDVDSQV